MFLERRSANTNQYAPTWAQILLLYKYRSRSPVVFRAMNSIVHSSVICACIMLLLFLPLTIIRPLHTDSEFTVDLRCAIRMCFSYKEALNPDKI